MSDVTRQELEGFDEGYDQADEPEPRGEFEPVPDGDYEAVIDQAVVTRSKNNAPMVKLTLKISGPASKGRLLWRNSVIRQDKASMDWLKRDLYAIGLTDCRVSDLPAKLPGVVGATIAVTVKTKDTGDQNVYLNHVVGHAPARTGKPASKPTRTRNDAPPDDGVPPAAEPF